ncbi:glycosyltransferase [Psychroserpens algicola]|uniref:Glycosyltransferase family 4 protein n=1 Tax=Psychroserpens algicola TaxID=1719034 RepID=A0ABT0H6H0_9FLAO|nr:glycosyltransferase [Psychroserpens algicola]MCK8479422.1 glycosyltransferase family 4 protein [Psychroserpens algicola]
MSKHLLVIGFVWPEPKSSAAGSRMLQLITYFKSQSYQITFASACGKSDNAFDLATIGVDKVSIQLNHSSFDTFIANLNPDVVLFDRFMTEEQFGWRISKHCPEAIKILDTEDLHFLRRARQQALKEDSQHINDYLFNDTAKREIASIYRCDLSLIISTAEMKLLKETFNMDDSLLLYVPFLVDEISEVQKNTFPQFEVRQHFITIGNFLHEPNYDALLYLKHSLWKQIRAQLPDAELHNYGAYASQKVNQLHNEKDGFLIKGFAEDVNEVMQHSRVLLAPMRFGAGLKGKLFDAMKNGTPYVSTPVGVEGIVDDIKQNHVCETAEEFVNYAVELYGNKPLWTSMQDSGFKVLHTQFSKVKFEKQLTERLNEVSEHLKTHRKRNFIGQLLQHHSMQSTKFMSKWIEAKNA